MDLLSIFNKNKEKAKEIKLLTIDNVDCDVEYTDIYSVYEHKVKVTFFSDNIKQVVEYMTSQGYRESTSDSLTIHSMRDDEILEKMYIEEVKDLLGHFDNYRESYVVERYVKEVKKKLLYKYLLYNNIKVSLRFTKSGRV